MRLITICAIVGFGLTGCSSQRTLAVSDSAALPRRLLQTELHDTAGQSVVPSSSVRNDDSEWSVPLRSNSLRCTLPIRDPSAATQSCGCWNSMMLPVSKWTRTCLLLKPSTNSIMSRGLSR